MQPEGGYILLARQMLESEIMNKPPLYFKLWAWMLLRAKFKPQKGLSRGQFKTSIKEMQEAMSYQVGYRKEAPSAKQIRGVYESLTKGSMIGTTKGTGGMIITILNYDKYQDPKTYEGHNEGAHEGKVEGTPYNIEERKKEITTGKFALSFFSPVINGWDKTKLEQTIDGFVSTRKTGQISSGVIQKEIEYWKQYPNETINAALTAYVDGQYWKSGKSEKYFRGIIRGKDKAIQKESNQSLFQKAF